MLIVRAKSVEEYLDKYYKQNRYKGRGEEYAKVLLNSYKSEYKERGYVCTSHHDNVTGKLIAWPKYPNK